MADGTDDTDENPVGTVPEMEVLEPGTVDDGTVDVVDIITGETPPVMEVPGVVSEVVVVLLGTDAD